MADTDHHNLAALKEHIFGLSEEKEDWNKACFEWKFDFADEEPLKCPCGVEIRYKYFIENLINNNRTFVGSTCVKRFTNQTLVDTVHEVELSRKRVNPGPLKNCVVCNDPIKRVVVTWANIHKKCVKVCRHCKFTHCNKFIGAEQVHEGCKDPGGVRFLNAKQCIYDIQDMLVNFPEDAKLSSWEEKFMDSIDDRINISDKQLAVLNKISQAMARTIAAS